MGQGIKRVAVSGAAGQIAYSLLFRLAAGELFGNDQPIALHLLEVAEHLGTLQGVVMEIDDCAFPLLHEVKIGSEAREVFRDVEVVFLVGAKPRGPGMERKDLLFDNGQIFVGQGKALGEVAAKEVVVLVVGNPCNTNCLIAQKHGQGRRFFAMTRLDQNRAQSCLAKKANLLVEEIEPVVIWGNHSSTQVPDYFNAKIQGKPALEVIDKKWLESEFVSQVQKRGAAVIAARGKSSAASASQAAIEAMRSLLEPTPKGEFFSMGVSSNQNPYGITPGIIFSFPCRSQGMGKVEIVPGFAWDGAMKEKIAITEKELLEEKEMVRNLL